MGPATSYAAGPPPLYPVSCGESGTPVRVSPTRAGAYRGGVEASGRPVRVALVNDYELIVVGVAALLEPFRDRVEVVELDSNLPVLRDVDVILYDTFGQVQGRGVDVDALVDGGSAK